MATGATELAALAAGILFAPYWVPTHWVPNDDTPHTHMTAHTKVIYRFIQLKPIFRGMGTVTGNTTASNYDPVYSEP